MAPERLPSPPRTAAEKPMTPSSSPDAEIDFVVIQAVHDPGEGGQCRPQREREKHDAPEVDAHGARRFLVLRHGADGQPDLVR